MAMECYQRGKELLGKGELEESFRTLSDFIETQKRLQVPENWEELVDAFNARGHIKYLWVDFDGAVEDYTEAIRRNPDFAVAYYNRGQIHYRLGRYKLAEQDLTKALEIKPDFSDAQKNLEQVRRDLESGHRFNQADKFVQLEERS